MVYRQYEGDNMTNKEARNSAVENITVEKSIEILTRDMFENQNGKRKIKVKKRFFI
jgi:hypothetical protein